MSACFLEEVVLQVGAVDRRLGWFTPPPYLLGLEGVSVLAPVVLHFPSLQAALVGKGQASAMHLGGVGRMVAFWGIG